MGAGQSSSSRRRPGDEEIDRVLELIRLQNQVIQALTPHVNAQSQPLPPPNTPPPAPIPGAPPSSHDPPGASPMVLPMPPPSTPAPATSPSTSYLRTCTICGKEAYWRNGCCMNPTCAATRLSINCTLMHCNLCFRFLIFTKGGARSPFSKYLHYCDFEDIVYCQKTMDSILLPRYQCTGQTHHWQMLPSPGGEI